MEPSAKKRSIQDDDTAGSSDDVLESEESINKPPCKYGSDCYRKNPVHFEKFSHPAAGR